MESRHGTGLSGLAPDKARAQSTINRVQSPPSTASATGNLTRGLGSGKFGKVTGWAVKKPRKDNDIAENGSRGYGNCLRGLTIAAVICSSAFCAFAGPVSISVHTQHNPNMSIGLVAYGAIKSQTVADWLNARYDWMIGGEAIRLNQAYPDKTWWPVYRDMAGVYASEMYDVQDIATANKFILEKMMLHSSIDMKVTPGLEWNESERFDFFEPTVKGARVGGVLTYNGSSYSDETDRSWYGTAGYYGAPGVTVSNTLYVGYMEPFDQMNFTILTARVGGSMAYQYWNGSAWSTLPLQSDGTGGLTANGRVYFYPPSDWARTSVNNSKVKYWVRATITGASTNPVYLRLFGDAWKVASGSNNSRGWSTTSPSRINTGSRLEYNPTPPSSATARFPYQARVTGGWVSNSMFGNPSDIQNGMRSWGKYLSDWTINYLPPGGDSVMFDNGGASPGQLVSPANFMDYFDFNHSNTWAADSAAMYVQIVNDLHSHFGDPIPGVSGFQVGTNGYLGPGDWVLCEGWWCQHNAYAPLPNYKLAEGYDAVAPDNNPTGKKLITTCMDNISELSPLINYSYWHYFDRSNRSPLLCLAMHFIGWNPNTVLNYNTNGYYYYTSDEVNLFAPATAIVDSVAADATSAAKTITLRDASGCDSSLNNKVRIGTKAFGDTVTGTLKGNVLTTTDSIYNSYPAGNAAYCIQAQHQSAIPTPSNSQVYNWVNYFPAMSVDIGTPDGNGYRGGARATSEAGNTPWKRAGAPDYISGLPVAACASGNCSDVWRRDFSGGIVLLRPFSTSYGMAESEIDVPSQPLDLGGTYYPLNADGTTGAAVTSIQLKAAESAILLKVQVGGGSAGDTAPPVVSP